MTSLTLAAIILFAALIICGVGIPNYAPPQQTANFDHCRHDGRVEPSKPGSQMAAQTDQILENIPKSIYIPGATEEYPTNDQRTRSVHPEPG